MPIDDKLNTIGIERTINLRKINMLITEKHYLESWPGYPEQEKYADW